MSPPCLCKSGLWERACQACKLDIPVLYWQGMQFCGQCEKLAYTTVHSLPPSPHIIYICSERVEDGWRGLRWSSNNIGAGCWNLHSLRRSSSRMRYACSSK